MSFKILVTEPIPGPFVDELADHFEVTVAERGSFYTEEALIEAIEPYDGLLSLLTNPVTEAVIEAGKNLKIIANMAVGYNNIDLEAAEKRNITVTNTPDVLTEATAELAIGLMFATARKFSDAERYLRDGKFDIWDPNGFLGMRLSGKTLGIIGMGRIGYSVAQKARVMGMDIIYHNRSRLPEYQEAQIHAKYYITVDKLLQSADVVSLHCPLNDDSHHLINADNLRIMNEQAILINTSRGPVVDEVALAEALHNGEIGGAGLDVFEREPKVYPRLLTAPNAVLLPHIGSATIQARKEMARICVESIRHIAEGKPADELDNFVC